MGPPHAVELRSSLRPLGDMGGDGDPCEHFCVNADRGVGEGRCVRLRCGYVLVGIDLRELVALLPLMGG